MERRDLLRKHSNDLRVRIIIYDGNEYARAIYDDEQEVSKLFKMLEVVEQKLGIDLIIEFLKYKYSKADKELANFIRTLKVKFGVVK